MALEVADSASATKSRSQKVLPSGSFLPFERRLNPHYYTPDDFRHFMEPASVNDDLKSLSSGDLKSITTSVDSDLKSEEVALKELLAIHNVSKWVRLAMEELTSKFGQVKSQEDKESVASCLTHLALQLQSLDADLEDRISTKLANTILRRRDLHLESLRGEQHPDLLRLLRAAPFLHRSLFGVIPAELVSATKEIHHSRDLHQLAWSSSKRSTSGPSKPFQADQPSKGSNQRTQRNSQPQDQQSRHKQDFRSSSYFKNKESNSSAPGTQSSQGKKPQHSRKYSGSKDNATRGRGRSRGGGKSRK